MKTLLLLAIILLSAISISAQTFDPSRDNEQISFTDANGVTGPVQSHYLQVYLDTTRIGDDKYIGDCINFLKTLPAKPVEIFITEEYSSSVYSILESESIRINKSNLFSISNGSTTIRMDDELNILDKISDLEHSGLFTLVSICPIGTLNDTPPSLPNDLRFNEQWYLKQAHNNNLNADIDADKAWWVSRGDNTKVRIYIIDSGVESQNHSVYHEDLTTSSVIGGTNYVIPTDPNEYDPLDVDDETGHGTLIAGFIGAKQNNFVGISGLSPKTKVICDKISVSTNLFTADIERLRSALNAIASYKNSHSDECVIATISFSYTPEYTPLVTTLNTCRNAGVIIICSSGNYISSYPNHYVMYPAKYAGTYANMITVGATTKSDTRASYSMYSSSSTNKELTLLAPGGDGTIGMLSTSYFNYTSYDSEGGTSFAVPLVAGAIALMASIDPTMSYTTITDKLAAGCENRPTVTGNWNATDGYGRLNAFNSVVSACDPNLPSLPANTTTNLTKNYRMSSNVTLAYKCTLNVKTGKVLILDQNKTLTFPNGTFSKIHMESGSTFIQRKGSTINKAGEFLMETGSYYCVEDNASFDLSGQGPNGPTDYGCAAFWGGSLIVEDGATLTIDKGAFVTVKDGGAIYLGNNSHLVFGGKSYLSLGENSNIYFGSNASMTFRDSSYIYADPEEGDDIHFRGITDTTKWDGIFLDSNLVSDTLEHCVFTGAKTAVTIRNNSVSGRHMKVFDECTFNVPDGGMGIYGENMFGLLMEDNTFNISNAGNGVLIKNYVNPGSYSMTETAEDPSIYYHLNVVDNTFNGGNLQMFLWNNASNKSIYYIEGNHFLNAVTLGFGGRKLSGNFKNNTIYAPSSTSAYASGLWECNLNLFKNVITHPANGINITLGNINCAPVAFNGNWIWSGGKNSINSTSTSAAVDNINLNSTNLITKQGGNTFTIHNTNAYHLFGSLPDSIYGGADQPYNAQGNCWDGNAGLPRTFLYTPTIGQLSVLYNAPSCRFENYTGYDVIEKGDGIRDTIWQNAIGLSSAVTDDELLYSQAMDDAENGDYPAAISDLKGIIDNYPGAMYVSFAVGSLYDMYVNLDTINNQSAKDLLYGNLKTYLNEKILGQYAEDLFFVPAAYSVILMCETNMKDFDAALDGYDFIATYHPDAEVRLMASWDYAAVADIAGSLATGGGEKENCIQEKSPVQRKVKEVYDNVSNSQKGKTKISEGSLINNEAKKNLSSLKNLSGVEKQNKFMEDLKLIIGNNPMKTLQESNRIIPNQYTLEQNYPNPFNPTTNIKYSLPKSGFVSIKIYDIVGRMVKELVSEFRETGNYSIVFDGSGISSGVYFYKLETPNFVDTKRMVLIK